MDDSTLENPLAPSRDTTPRAEATAQPSPQPPLRAPVTDWPPWTAAAALVGGLVLAALAVPLSYPASPEPLMSLPRYLVVLFPVSIWLASWLAARPRAQLPVLAVSAALLALFVAEFATWHWVA